MTTLTTDQVVEQRTVLATTRNPDGDRFGLVESDWRAIRAAAFGVLVRLACPKLEHYQSDLYHDAHYVDRVVTPDTLTAGRVSFHYGVRDTGTTVGSTVDAVKPHCDETFEITVIVLAGPYTTKAVVRAAVA